MPPVNSMRACHQGGHFLAGSMKTWKQKFCYYKIFPFVSSSDVPSSDTTTIFLLKTANYRVTLLSKLLGILYGVSIAISFQEWHIVAVLAPVPYPFK